MDGISCFWPRTEHSIFLYAVHASCALIAPMLYWLQISARARCVYRCPIWFESVGLRHLKPSYGFREDTRTFLHFLSQSLSISSSIRGIETLEITITCVDVGFGHGKVLFSSDAERSTLDEVLTSDKFGSLQQAVFGLSLDSTMSMRLSRTNYQRSLEFERELTLPYINLLFPMLRALSST
jgi:hypothetical protein